MDMINQIQKYFANTSSVIPLLFPFSYPLIK